MVERADDPWLFVLAENAVQPFNLLFDPFVAVEHDETGVLVFKGVAGLAQALRAILGQCKLRSPVIRELYASRLRLLHFVVANHWHTWNHGVEPSPCTKPFTPFSVRLGGVDQVASMQNKLRFWRIRVGFANDS